MSTPTVGFIGLGRLGTPLAKGLLDAGYTVVTTNRGRAEEFTAAGGVIAGDGTARAVAEVADVVVTCMPSARAFVDVLEGDSGLLSASRAVPLIESSTLPLGVKDDARKKVLERGAHFLDAPVSGTPPMVAAKIAVIYASGDRDTYLTYKPVMEAMCPKASYVGTALNGSKVKFVAQFLATVHVTAAAEAMVYAERAGLDLTDIAELISTSPGAVSGQFQIRGPMIAGGNFDGTLVTVDMLLKDLDEVISYAGEIGAPTDLSAVVAEHYHRLSVAGHGGDDPAVLFRDLLAGPR